MRISCCKNCEKREIGCHSKCKEYIEQSKELHKENQSASIQARETMAYIERIYKTIKKSRR